MQNEMIEEARNARPLKIGFPVTCLILGVISIAFSIFLIGGVLAIIAIVLGVIHIRKSKDLRNMTIWGISLSFVGLLATLSMGYFYFQIFKDIQDIRQAENDDEISIQDWEGVLSPDITLKTMAGEDISLSQLKGKRVILDFWATWCGPCVKEIPHFIQLVKDTSRDDLIIIGISNENSKKLQNFIQKRGINYPIVSGKIHSPPFDNISSIPTTFFIDKNGVIQNVLIGYHDLQALKKYALADNYGGELRTPPGNETFSDEDTNTFE